MVAPLRLVKKTNKFSLVKKQKGWVSYLECGHYFFEKLKVGARVRCSFCIKTKKEWIEDAPRKLPKKTPGFSSCHHKDEDFNHQWQCCRICGAGPNVS